MGAREVATMAGRVRWGIIGCGDVVERKSGPAFQAVSRSCVTAVMRRSFERAEVYARSHGIPLWTSDANDLIASPTVDAVYVATPPGHHEEYALRVCAAGKPCLVEKPLGRSHAESRRIVEAFEKKGVPLFVAYYRRRLPKFQAVQQILESERLGQIVSIRYHYSGPARHDWRVEPAISGGGLFADVGCHVLDLLDLWFGPLEFLGGGAANRSRMHEVEDVVSLAFRTGAGAVGSASWNFVAPIPEDSLIIEGLRGRLQLACMDWRSPVVIESSDLAAGLTGDEHTTAGVRRWLGRPRKRGRLAREERSFSASGDSHSPMVRNVVDRILEKRPEPAPLASALRTAGLVNAVLGDYYGGRDDEFWERPASWASQNATAALHGYRRVVRQVPDPAHRLSEEQARFFCEQGYLGPFACEAPALDEVEVQDEGNLPNLHLRDPCLLRVCSDPSIVDRVRQLLGGAGATLFKTRLWVTPGYDTTQTTPWHQDVGENNGGYLADGTPVRTVTVWLAIDPATRENGSLRLLPGTHRRLYGNWRQAIKAELESEGALSQADLEHEVTLDLKPGEFIIFDAWILHASWPNRSGSRRAALNMRFTAQGDEREAEPS